MGFIRAGESGREKDRRFMLDQNDPELIGTENACYIVRRSR